MTPVLVSLATLWNTDLLSTPGQDAVCLGPGGRTAVTLPVGAAAEALNLRWTAVGPPAQGGPAAAVEVRFVDGTSVRVPAIMGDEVGGPGAPGRHAIPELLGTDPSGAQVLGKVWSLATGRPDTVVQELVVTSRVATHRLCIVSLEAGPSRSPLEVTDTRDWYSFIVGPSLAAPLPQALPVEAPAGTHGATRPGPDGHLVYADGTRARFWGVDLYQQRALPPKEDADAYAATLAHLGFNMVRLHHIDFNAAGLVNPRRGLPGEPPLVPAMQDRLDFFLSRLKAHGVYLFLEAATYRELDAVDGVNHPGGVPNGHKLVSMWEDDWFNAYVAAFRALWDRTNPYTGLRYADDPMVAVVELSNEHSLLANWGGGIETLPTVHIEVLNQRWNAWLKDRYGDDATLAAAWKGGNRGGLEPGESLEAGTVRRSPAALAFRSAFSPRRTDDLYRFYHSLEERFYTRLSDAAVAMGFRAPMVSTLNYERPDLLRLGARWQVQDMHFEWDYPANNTLRASSVLASPREQGLLETAANATVGMAFTVSELNEAAPNPFQAEAPLAWATMASVQDWDALIWNSYALSDDPADKTWISDAFDLRAATVKLAQSPTASTLFRAGWLAPAGGSFRVYWDEAAARLGGWGGEQDRPAELSDLAFWLSHKIRSDFGAAPVPKVDGAASPGVGWWADPGLLVLDRPEIQARVGPATPARGDGAGPRDPSGLRVDAAQWAAVSLASVDGRPLASAQRALLTIGTRQENTGMAWERGGTRIAAMGTAPVLVEPLVGEVSFAWTGRPVVQTLGPDGSTTGTLPVQRTGRGWWRITLDASVRTPLLLVESSPR